MGLRLLSLAVMLIVLSSAHMPAAQGHPMLDMDSIVRGVAAARAEVESALADPAAAFEQYLDKFAAVAAPRGHPQPGGPQDSRTKDDRLRIFTENLLKVSVRNAAANSQALAFGITPFMHLTQDEFGVNYLGMTAASKAAAAEAEELFPQVSWSAADDAAATAAIGAATEAAASRRLLARTQMSGSDVGTKLLAQTTSSSSSGSSSSGSSSSGGDGEMELAQPPAGAHSVPPAQHLPRMRPGRATGPATGMPTLPFNPEPGASGCVAQRNYPYSDVVPPADGVDWVAAGGTTAVKDQGQCGSCVAFATVALAEFMHMRKYGTTNTTTDLSEQDLLDCTMGDGCQGQYQQAYANLIGCGGIALEAEAPYRAADGGQDLCRPAKRYNAMTHGAGGGWASVRTDSDTLAQAVSQAPVMVTLDATDWALYAGGVLGCDAPGKGVNHAVAVVGYFNTVRQPNGEDWDLFLIRNSFSSWWGSGNGGYAGHMFIRKGCSLAGQSPGPSALHGLDGVLPLFG